MVERSLPGSLDMRMPDPQAGLADFKHRMEGARKMAPAEVFDMLAFYESIRQAKNN